MAALVCGSATAGTLVVTGRALVDTPGAFVVVAMGAFVETDSLVCARSWPTNAATVSTARMGMWNFFIRWSIVGDFDFQSMSVLMLLNVFLFQAQFLRR